MEAYHPAVPPDLCLSRRAVPAAGIVTTILADSLRQARPTVARDAVAPAMTLLG
jgi:hypothetical protein